MKVQSKDKLDLNVEELKGAKALTLDVVLKIATPFLTVLGLLVGVWQFNEQQDFNDAQEFKRRIWEKRLEAYSEIGSLTAQIVTSTNDSSKMDSLYNNFEQLYWGKMPLIQDEAVESALQRFKGEVIDFKNKESSDQQLKKRGYELMKTCQQSLHNSWKTLSYEE